MMPARAVPPRPFRAGDRVRVNNIYHPTHKRRARVVLTWSVVHRVMVVIELDELPLMAAGMEYDGYPVFRRKGDVITRQCEVDARDLERI